MRVVVVFGGGGAKSLACLGAWKALTEAGLTPSHLLKPAGLRRAIERFVPATRFDQLRIPLTVTATDLDSGDLVLFGDVGAQHAAPLQDAVPLHEALYASCALPLYFPPAVIDGRRLADGGLRAVLALEVARAIPADLVVALHVGPGFDEPPPPPSTALHRLLPPPLIRAQGEAIRVMMAAQTELAIAAWPRDAARLVVVRAVAEREATFAVGAGERYLDAGYHKTREALSTILARATP